MGVRIAHLVTRNDVVVPDPICGHGPHRLLWPWHPEVKRIQLAAKRARRKAQIFCKACRRWVPYEAFA